MRSAAPRLFTAVLAALLFWCVRAPWMAQPLVGEEGLYAHLYDDRPAGPDYGLMCRIRGAAVWSELDHPAPLYEWMRGIGYLARSAGMAAPPSGTARIVWARVLNCLPQWLAWTFLAFVLEPGLASVLVLACLMALPMAVGASLYLQTDTTCGWLLGAFLGLAAFKGRTPWLWAAAAAVGFLGKQEWLVCLCLAMGLTLFWNALALRRGGRGGAGLGAVAGTGAAAALGAWAARAVDPGNWDGGLYLMVHLGGGQNILSHPEAMGRWLHGLGNRALFLWPLLLGLGLQTWLALREGWTRTPLGRRFALGWSWGLTLPFLVSIWGVEYRYFAPAMAAVSTALALQAQDLFGSMERRRLARNGIIALGCIVCLDCAAGWGGRSITEIPGALTKDMQIKQAWVVAEAAKTGCVPFVSVSYEWMMSLPDFAGSALGREGAQSWLARSPGHAWLCP